jgi:bis(5'-nucleosidyl)-tetraphosphatase
MQTKIVHSYGIIPIRKTETGLEMLVIHMYGSAGGTHWTFPKGRPEPGETALQSALRECREEVSLTPVQVWEDAPIIETYTFTHEDTQIEKTVTFYIGVIEQGEVRIQPEEIVEALWLPLTAVAERLTHESAQTVYSKAVQLITERT